jgi:hypothetical protein
MLSLNVLQVQTNRKNAEQYMRFGYKTGNLREYENILRIFNNIEIKLLFTYLSVITVNGIRQ